MLSLADILSDSIGFCLFSYCFRWFGLFLLAKVAFWEFVGVDRLCVIIHQQKNCGLVVFGFVWPFPLLVLAAPRVLLVLVGFHWLVVGFAGLRCFCRSLMVLVAFVWMWLDGVCVITSSWCSSLYIDLSGFNQFGLVLGGSAWFVLQCLLCCMSSS